MIGFCIIIGVFLLVFEVERRKHLARVSSVIRGKQDADFYDMIGGTEIEHPTDD